MKDIIFQETTSSDDKVKVVILLYTGVGDPVKYLNEAVHNYVGNEGYNEFIDANMDNPWIRIIVKGINEMGQNQFIPNTSHFQH